MRVEIRATLYLWRKRGQGAAARRHNRIQDTLPQPHFTAVILTPPPTTASFEPVMMMNRSSFTSHLPRT